VGRKRKNVALVDRKESCRPPGISPPKGGSPPVPRNEAPQRGVPLYPGKSPPKGSPPVSRKESPQRGVSLYPGKSPHKGSPPVSRKESPEWAGACLMLSVIGRRGVMLLRCSCQGKSPHKGGPHVSRKESPQGESPCI
jgi:hypothetical protein